MYPSFFHHKNSHTFLPQYDFLITYYFKKYFK